MSSADLETALRALEILCILGGGARILWQMSAMATKFELVGTQQAKEISELKIGVEKLGGVLITIAQQAGRMDRIEERQLAEGKRMDEITIRVNRAINGVVEHH